MLKLRKAENRGETRTGWLTSYHSFSFGEYYDPANMGHGILRVINDDIIEADTGFGEHGHRNMEIVTYVIEGEIAHGDSLGNSYTLKAGEVQRMSAGRAIRHSEFNPSKTDRMRLLQIWLLPEKENIPPSYEQKVFSKENKLNKLCPIVSKEGKENSLKINQNVNIYASILDKGREVEYVFNSCHTGESQYPKKLDSGLTQCVRQNDKNSERLGWIQVALGEIEVNGVKLKNGDGLAIDGETSIKIKSNDIGSEFLLFD